MFELLAANGLRPLMLKGKALLPVVQGGMGVGVSAHRLASAVARTGALGTIASVDLRHHHADLVDAGRGVRDRATLEAHNLIALDREVRAARVDANGQGAIAVNVMKAVDQHPALIRQACESGADAIVMGAGLPLDLPELANGYPDVALVPILSDARGVALVLKRWMRKGRLPDAVVIEHPAHAGGHLGAARIEDLGDARFDFARVMEEIHVAMRELGLEPGAVPFIAAGGINTHERVVELLAIGYSAVQLGTAFAVSEEGDAHPEFKRILAEAGPADMVEFISVAGLPARAVRTPWLDRYLSQEARLREKAAQRVIEVKAALRETAGKCAVALNCLSSCGLRDGISKFGQFCIDSQLAAAMRGEVAKGLFFRGSASLPFGDAVRPARELVEYLLSGRMPAALIRR